MVKYKIKDHTFAIGHTVEAAIKRYSATEITREEMDTLVELFKILNNHQKVYPNKAYKIPYKITDDHL